jgi:hypothetical protein
MQRAPLSWSSPHCLPMHSESRGHGLLLSRMFSSHRNIMIITTQACMLQHRKAVCMQRSIYNWPTGTRGRSQWV